MIQVKSSDELMQRTGEGDAYVYKPMNLDLYKFHRQLDQSKELKAEQEKARKARELQDRLQWSPEAVTQPFEQYQSLLVNENIDRKARILSKGVYDPNGEDERLYDEVKWQTRQNAAMTKEISKEYAATSAAINKDKTVNQDEAHKTIYSFGMDENGNAIKKPSDFRFGQILPSVYANPSAVNTENTFKIYADNLATQAATYKKAFEDGDTSTMEANKSVGKLMVFDRDGRIKTDANGRPILDVNDETVASYTGVYQNPETLLKRTQLDHAEVLVKNGKKPGDYGINDYVAERLRPYIPISTSRQRDSEDKASVKSDGKGNYGDTGGATVVRQKHYVYNVTAESANGGEPTTQSGIGFDFMALGRKGKQLVLKATNNQTIYDADARTKKDNKNLAVKDITVSGVVSMVVEKSNGNLVYRMVKPMPGETEDEHGERVENAVAQSKGKYTLKQFVVGGTQDASNIVGDEAPTAENSNPTANKALGINRNSGVVYIPLSEMKAKIINAANPSDQDKYAKEITYSEAIGRIEIKRAAYEAKQAQQAKATPAKVAAPKQATPAANKVTPKKDPLGLF